MWISQIELTNFKSYERASLEFPQPKDGENIVLIGGMNGYGKTSLLEALYLCLYGMDAIIHLARAGLKSDEVKGYPSFLEKAFNGEAKRAGKDTMTARVVISFTPTKAVDIQRRWYFRNGGNWTREEDVVVREVSRGVPAMPKRDGQAGFSLSDYLSDNFIPAHIAPFFFFDGEEVKKLADQDRIETVKQGLEQLLGVLLLRDLSDRLLTFETNRRSSVSNVDVANIERLLQALTTDEARLKELHGITSAHTTKLKQLTEERNSLIERLTAAGGGRGDVATVKDLVEEREQLRNALREVQKRIESILANKLPFHLVPRELVLHFKQQLRAEIALEAWTAERRSLEPKRDKFTDAFLTASEPSLSPELTDEQVTAIKARIQTAWESLFHPPPEGCAEKFLHGYLNEGLREKAIGFLDSIAVGQQDVHDLLATQRQLNERIEDLGKKISRVEGIDADGTLNELRRRMQEVTQEMEAAEIKVRENDREVTALEVTVSNNRAAYGREKERLDESSPVRSLIGKSERVRAAIDELVPSLFPLKVRALSAAMTRVYKKLAHKNQVSEIIIENDGTTRILGKTGKEISFDRSAGENQIFATALIAGLAEISGVKAPLVVDTPLGRLDSLHRENIFQFWISNPSRQVILLSQDKEIDSEFYARIHPNVSMTYMLEHTDVGDGIGRTTVKPGAYFRSATE